MQRIVSLKHMVSLPMRQVIGGFHSSESMFLEYNPPCVENVKPSSFYYEVLQICCHVKTEFVETLVKTSPEYGSSFGIFRSAKRLGCQQ